MLASLLLVPLLAAPDLPRLGVRAGTAIELDARVEEAEWADAFSVTRDHPAGGTVRFHLKRNGPWLALALAGEGPYRGEVLRLYVTDAAGAFATNVVLPLGQPHTPPALWRRGTPDLLQDARFGPGECPRACRVRLDVGRTEAWAAEILLRLSALGIGREELRDVRGMIRLTVHQPEPAEVFALPGGASDPSNLAQYARLESPDGWGAGERWGPVPPEVSLEFNDHELLYRLFLEHDRISLRETPDQLVISNAVQPRSLTRIGSLRRELEAGMKRNPTLPAWTYFLGRLLHEANLYAEAGELVEGIPEPLRGFDSFANLAAEHYFDVEEFQKALDVCQAHPLFRARTETVKLALQGRRAAEAERDALAQDAAKELKNPRVRFVTERGAIVCELFEDEAPHTVRNFIDLVLRRSYYDGLRFHEVAGGRHAALGDPRTRLGATETRDGPPWRIRGDKCPRPLLRGYLAAVPVGETVYHGSHLFFALAPHFGMKNTLVFGRVVEGMDVLLSLEQDDRVERVEIVSKRNHAYDPLGARLDH